MEKQHKQKAAIGLDCSHEGLELQLPEQTAFEIAGSAERLSVSPEQLSILNIGEKLGQLEEEFRRSAEYTLKKNADLYQPLS